MSKANIVGAIASATGIVTLYLDNGKEVNLKKDSARTKAILDQTVEALARGEKVTIDLDSLSVEKQIERKTNGLVRFFREKILRQAGPEGAVQSIGKIEPIDLDEGVVVAPGERLVAVIGEGDKAKRVPGVEKLAKQMKRAVETNNVVGFQCFLERIGMVIDHRSHSMEELLDFMSRGDLPIADDGSIVAYKVLKTRSDKQIVDCHTGKVIQRLGSHVSMPESLVDQNRRHECSTGLHIARRGYLGRFSGDVVTIVKVAPEDVIAVPPGEPDKMRAAAYHVVAILPKDVHQLLRSNQPMTSNPTAARILADVIKGNHIGIVEYVRIYGPMGNDVEVTPVDGAAPKPKAGRKKAKALDDAKPEEKVEVSIPELRDRVDAARTAAMTGDMSAAVNAKATSYKERRKTNAATKAKKATPTPKPAAAPTTAPVYTHPKGDAVRAALAAGKSYRTIESELGICRKTIRKLDPAKQPK